MKTCFKCNQTKPIGEYYKHSKMADNHLNKCKDCTRNDVAEHRIRNLDKIRAYDRARGSRQPPEYLREYRQKNPNKYKAHQAVNYAIRSGKMKRGDYCSECGGSFHVEAHHDDYAFPLTVRWLCSVCHKQWHRDNGEAKNP